jgi:hypothetical protein
MDDPISQAQRAFEGRRIHLSNPDAAPLFAWSLNPMSKAEVTAAVEADGMAPYTVLGGWDLAPEFASDIPGKPPGLDFCWLLVVRIRGLTAERVAQAQQGTPE